MLLLWEHGNQSFISCANASWVAVLLNFSKDRAVAGSNEHLILMAGVLLCRGTWHLKDHVPLLQRLRWGELPFANLRYSPGSRLDWECGNRTGSEEFRRFDCDWQGSHLRPRDLKPRKARELTAGNKDCWWDSVELREVWHTPLTDAWVGIMTEHYNGQ